MPRTIRPPDGPGTRLAWHRTRQGLSQAELAIRAGQTTQTIGGIETRRWATGSKRSRIILDLAAGLGIQALDLMDQTPEGKPRMNDPKPAKTEHSATADDLVYRNHVNAAIDQLRLALRTADTGERIRLLTGALANTGNAIGQLAQFDSDGRARRQGNERRADENDSRENKEAGRTVHGLPASLFYGHPVHAERRGMNILPDRSMWRNP